MRWMNGIYPSFGQVKAAATMTTFSSTFFWASELPVKVMSKEVEHIIKVEEQQ